MSHQQYLNVLHLCRHLEHLAEAAYAVSFHIDMQDVTFSITPQNRLANMAKLSAQNPDKGKVAQEVKNLPYFMAQGYALGIAYASALSGDTVGSVLIGGMCTVTWPSYLLKIQGGSRVGT